MTWNLRMYTNVYKCINGYIHLYIHPTFIKNHHLQLNCAFSTSWSARPWSSPEEINFWETISPNFTFTHYWQRWIPPPCARLTIRGRVRGGSSIKHWTWRWPATFMECSSVFASYEVCVCTVYDAVLEVVESDGLWRSDFQIGSRVLKKVLQTYSYV